VLLDTNVVISAMFYQGDEFELVMRAHRENIFLCISDHILAETINVVCRKFPEHLMDVEEFLKVAEVEVVSID